ncbi:transposase [Nocardia mangyaensis]|nr:transposase [Nocardia mangyaensis]
MVNAWRAKHPRFHMHFTPAGSSWLNQVERWFEILTGHLLRRGVHKSAALDKDIVVWIEQRNADPKPFVWPKTAEEILESLAQYLERIAGATHSSCNDPWNPSFGPGELAA